MKHIRLFEELDLQYKVGDYILIKYMPKDKCLLKLKDFVNKTIGKIKFMNDRSVMVQYYDIPDNIKHYFNDKVVGSENIKNCAFFWYNNNTINRLATGDEITEIEMKENSKKFNL